MTALLIDGAASAASLRVRVAEAVTRLAPQGVTPGLAVVLVGENPASQVYVRSKAKQTVEAGMRSFDHVLAATVSQDELLALHRAVERGPSG
jgi:methylenetetrahydrofolate dehydrogenase (NADP+)/methenyltetrahydrofolate cyclohydrolase